MTQKIFTVQKVGASWMVHDETFLNLQESNAGFGDTVSDAFSEFLALEQGLEAPLFYKVMIHQDPAKGHGSSRVGYLCTSKITADRLADKKSIICDSAHVEPCIAARDPDGNVWVRFLDIPCVPATDRDYQTQQALELRAKAKELLSAQGYTAEELGRIGF
jgi:hypothetical protein